MIFEGVMLWAILVSIPTAIATVLYVLYAILPRKGRPYSTQRQVFLVCIACSVGLWIKYCPKAFHSGLMDSPFVWFGQFMLGVIVIAYFVMRLVWLNTELDESVGLKSWVW